MLLADQSSAVSCPLFRASQVHWLGHQPINFSFLGHSQVAQIIVNVVIVHFPACRLGVLQEFKLSLT